jgi:hypothetical protein
MDDSPSLRHLDKRLASLVAARSIQLELQLSRDGPPGRQQH